MRTTLAAVNAALRSEGIAAELVRGRGYFYFAGAAFDRAPETMVTVYRLAALTVDGWVAEARRLIAKIPARVGVEARETKVIEDPGTPGLFVIIWDGQLCSPTFNSRGAADICLGMYQSGARKPELLREV